ncbi:Ca2+-binding protein, RTX toxin-related [Pseudosulfitobacter pseudonitzschiae]|uniref:Hedgehog/Intein (Hint) domain-containing protein n=1 Tax=Pseudosulfitobacter pseudonitzschiae TaxID=1402135 RepID=A0A073J7S3_9RHOB|nr:Hint domain-containing protein [Pseudosulfitobacter pseudonitzschiae]KEJ97761.1 hypothetical protein SUH3_01900 [Pseudosulfitobacter pseudonitzschiae]QKS09029.1 Hint domain-containing protein [Pseudosulfitobacter pseudonitzschiae]SHE58777.1 Ca2+-binding protein, RTX toxin-related [Pseudosulfitobacter pseudonitzschiae]
MPTSYEVIFLGTLAKIDPTQSNEVVENAAGILGTHGSANDPLSSHVHNLSAERLSEDDNDTYDTDNGGGYDSFRIDGGTPQDFDAVATYTAVVHYIDGTTANVTAVVFQDVDGNTYLAPETTQNADQAALTAKPIQSIDLTGVIANTGDMAADRVAGEFKTAVDGTAGNDTMTVGYTDAQGDQITSGNDFVAGYDGDDLISTGAGDDTLIGGDGDDTLRGGAGADSMDGGTGRNVLDYSDSTSGVSANLLTNVVFGGYADGDTVIDMTDVAGSAFGDTLVLSNTSGAAWGAGGDDSLRGGTGDDSLFGGDGNDTLEGMAGSDTLYGGAGDDLIHGYEWMATPDGLDSNDLIHGEAGNDTLGGDEGDDTLFGGDDDDVLYGWYGDDQMFGDAGNDMLFGEAGDDLLGGGTGDDTLSGGTGNDTFVYVSGDGADTITDFNTGNTGALNDGDTTNNDFIDLSAFYDNIWELRADFADDGILNQSNTTDLGGDAVDYSDNTQFAAGDSLTFQGADQSSFATDNTGVVCFAAGTLILTPAGEVPVERLRPGDLVVTKDNGPRPVIWSNMRRLGLAELVRRPSLRPVEIKAGVFGNQCPLIVSPQHGIVVRHDNTEILLRAKHLAEMDGGTARVRKGCRGVTYCHLMFEQHEVIFSNGLPSESFFPGPEAIKTLDNAAYNELIGLFPALSRGCDRARVLRSYGKTARVFLRRNTRPARVDSLLSP